MAVDMGLSVAVPTVCLFQSGNGLFSDRRTKLFTSISPRFSSCQSSYLTDTIPLSRRTAENKPRQVLFKMPKSTGSSSSNDTQEDSEAPPNQTKAPFGYTRKDVLLIGLGVTVTGISLKSGLEFVGVDSLQAGNAVQLVMVLGLTIGWITTYIFRVSNKDMTYAQQLRDYENKVMQKRLEGLTEAELEALLEQVEEDKRRLASGEQVK